MESIILNKNYRFRNIRDIQRSNVLYYFILFMLWPFLAFLIAINNYKEKSSRRVVYFFIIYYGLSFVNNNVHMDSYRYAMALARTAQEPFSDFFKIMRGLYSDTNVDIVEPFISFVVSRFTSSANIYFAVWTALMGFFYLKSINLLNYRYQKRPTINALIVMLFFIFIAPITHITGVRMPTAMWIFFYAAYHVILYRDKRYLLLALSASLVHWSFISVNALLIVYYLIGNRNIIYLPLAITSFVLPDLMSPYFKLLSSKLGGAFQNRYMGYSNEDYVAAVKGMHEHSAWFIKIMDNSVYYFFIIAIIIIQLGSNKKLMKGRAEQNLFSFILLMISFVNYGSVIPSFGGRFQVLLFLFMALYLFLYFYSMGEKKISYINMIGLFPMLIYSAVQFRLGSESINVLMFGPIFGLPLMFPGASLAQFLFN